MLVTYAYFAGKSLLMTALIHPNPEGQTCVSMSAFMFSPCLQLFTRHEHSSLVFTSPCTEPQKGPLNCRVFKWQTRPVNFPLITLLSSQATAAHCIFPFISPVPLRQRQEWVFKGGMRVVVRGGAEEGETARLNLSFLPQGCVLLLLLLQLLSLCLKTD